MGKVGDVRCSGSGVFVLLSAIRPRTSSPPEPFPASTLALSLTRLAGSFTTLPRAVSSPLRTSCLTNPPTGAVPGEVAVDSGAARGTASGGAEHGGAETGGADPGGAATGGAEPGGFELGGAELEGVESGGAELQGAASSGGSTGALPRLSPQQLHEWLVRRTRLRSGATRAGGAGVARAGGAGVTAGAGVTGGTTTTGPGGAGSGGVGGAGARDPTDSGAAGVGASGAGGAGAGGARVRGTGAGGTGVGEAGARGVGAGGAGAVDPGGALRPQPYFVPLLQQVLGVPSSTSLTPLLCPLLDQSQLPYSRPLHCQLLLLTERREPASRPVLPVRTAHRVPRSRPPPVPGKHAMALRPSSVPLHVPLFGPPKSSLPAVPNPESDRTRATSPTVRRHLPTTE
ncbi:unnamed protein product, partial [Closterium sp. NIES-54]